MLKISLILDALRRQERERQLRVGKLTKDRPISPEEDKILRALEQLLTRAREERTVGILRLILTFYNADINVFKLEKELEEMLDEKNIVELVRKKFDKYKKDERMLDHFIGREGLFLQVLNKLIKIQNELLNRLKRTFEEKSKGKKPTLEQPTKNPTPGVSIARPDMAEKERVIREIFKRLE